MSEKKKIKIRIKSFEECEEPLVSMNKLQLEFYQKAKDISKERGYKLMSKSYTDKLTKLDFKCSKGHLFSSTLPNFTNAKNPCLECRENKSSKLEELRQLAKENGWNLLSDSFSSKEKLQFECLEGHLLEITPKNFRGKIGRGTPCQICESREYPRGRNFSSKEEYYKNICNIADEKGWKVISEKYISATTKMSFECPKGHKVDISPQTFKSKYSVNGCRICTGNCSKTAENKFRNFIDSYGGKVIGVYNGTHKYVECLCIEKHKVKVKPTYLDYKRNFCKICNNCDRETAKNNFIRTIEVEREGKVIGEYKSHKCKVEIECKNGHRYHVSPGNIIRDTNYCKKCYPISKGQGKFGEALDLLGYSYEQEYKFKGDNKRYDFKLEKYIIEFDGTQHFRVSDLFYSSEDILAKKKQIDIDKTLFAIKQELPILRFDYDRSRGSIEDVARRIMEGIDTVEEGSLKYWVSNKKMYDWLVNGVESKLKRRAKIVIKEVE